MFKTRMLVIGLVLSAAVVAQIWASLYTEQHGTWTQKLAHALPVTSLDWVGKDLPLAETEFLRNQVSNILRYDDHVFRKFTLHDGSRWFMLYAVYWGPQKATLKEAGEHTPDTCWVNSGWSRVAKSSGVDIQTPRFQLQPAEIGAFSLGGTSIKVAFWHLVDGKVHRYDQLGWVHGPPGFLHRLPNTIKDWLTYGLNQKREQFFIRIHSNEPIVELLKDARVVRLLGSLSGTGLFLRPPVD